MEDKRKECLTALKRSKEFVFDLETSGLDPMTDRIVGLVLGNSSKVWYFKFTGENSYPFLETMEMFRPVFMDISKTCVGHNLKFDYKFMLHFGIEIHNKLADTMHVAYLLDETRAGSTRLALKGKGGLLDEVFDVVLDTWEKSELNLGKGKGKSEEDYAIDDGRWTMQLWHKLYPQLRSQNLERVFWEILSPMIPIVANMELTGFKVDLPYLWNLKTQISKELKTFQEKLFSIAGCEFNPDSPKQVNTILFGPATDKLKCINLPVKSFLKKTKTGGYSVNEAALSMYAADGVEFCQAILDYRGKKKLLSTYIEPLIELGTKSPDSRIRASFNPVGTVTGRWCVAWDTLIKTSEGDIRIDSLTPLLDLEIYTHAGRFRRLLDVFYKGLEEMFEVTVSSGRKIKCTKGHRFYHFVLATEKIYEYRWTPLKDLDIGSSIIVEDSSGFSSDKITSIESVGIQGVWDIEVEEDHSYVGNGFVNHNSSSGPNLQNLPRDGGIREAFIAPEGKQLVVADYGQLELRIMAHQSGDKKMIDCYLKGEDIHDQTRVALGLSVDDRSVAKGSNFGFIYGMAPPTFKQNLWNTARMVKSLEDCSKFHFNFFQTYTGIKPYHNLIEKRIRERGWVVSLCGRYRRVGEEMKKNYGYALRGAINHTIQASAADIMCLAMRNLYKEIQKRALTNPLWREVKFLAQVHDELVSECPHDLVQEYIELKGKTMESALTLKVPLIAEAHAGRSWKEAK